MKSAHRENIWAYVEKKNPLTCNGLVLALLPFLDLSGKNVTTFSSGFFKEKANRLRHVELTAFRMASYCKTHRQWKARKIGKW